MLQVIMFILCEDLSSTKPMNDSKQKTFKTHPKVNLLNEEILV